jgi:hypothetical protein
MQKTRSGLYDKDTNCLKNRIFNSDPVNRANTVKRVTLSRVKEGKNSVIAVRNNKITMADLVVSYAKEGISEDKIPWENIHNDVLEELKKSLETAKPGKKIVKLNPITKKLGEFRMEEHVINPKKADGGDLGKASLDKYSTILTSLMKELGITDAVELMKRAGKDPSGCVKLTEKKYANHLVYALRVIHKYSPSLKKYLEGSMGAYDLEEAKYYYFKDVQTKRETNRVKLKLKWEEAMRIYNEVEKNYPYSQRHVLLAALVLMPPLRDNFGQIRISGSYTALENCYVASDKKIYIHDQKQSASKGLAVIKVPDNVCDIINQSLKIYPRDYLITQKNGTIYEKGKIWRLVLRNYEYSLNDFRKSYTTHVIDDLDISVENKMELLTASLHTVKVAISDYYFPSNDYSHN